ncbi:MAG: hypothetical protein ACFCVD_18875 [Nodosilinea sp.]
MGPWPPLAGSLRVKISSCIAMATTADDVWRLLAELAAAQN